MRIQIVDRIAKVSADAWNGLIANDHPFVKHQFLAALENSGCVSADTGWMPQHVLLYEDSTQRLVGALPMYLKSHSYGEYVFDWAWADAYQRAGMDYYPKLVVAVPFTPVTGPRILSAKDCDREVVLTHLVDAALQRATELGVSSMHVLFTTPEETNLLQARGLMRRVGTQFHWCNRSYSDFDHYLAAFSSKKRKKIKRERRRVREAGVEVRILSGGDLSGSDWNTFYQFYDDTIRNHGAIPYLSREFFHEIGKTLSDQVVMVVACVEGEQVAGALNLRSKEAMFGRYWGCSRAYSDLHFETCYYRAIEYAIEQKLERFEAGAQGEHKLSRGFLPAPTYSTHWLSHPQFAHAVSQFLDREALGIDHYMRVLDEHTPFRHAKE